MLVSVVWDYIKLPMCCGNQGKGMQWGSQLGIARVTNENVHLVPNKCFAVVTWCHSHMQPQNINRRYVGHYFEVLHLKKILFSESLCDTKCWHSLCPGKLYGTDLASKNIQWLKKLSQCFSNIGYMLNTIGSRVFNIPEIFCQILGHSSYKLNHMLCNSVEIW